MYGLCTAADTLWFGQSRCCVVVLNEYKGKDSSVGDSSVGDPCQRLMEHLVGILAKLILASGLLLVMDLCTFNLIFDSMTNPQGRRKRKRRRRVAQTWCLLLASPDPCPPRTACAHERSDQGLTNLYPTQVPILPIACPLLTHWLMQLNVY